MRIFLDRVGLILAGLVASAGAWAFWHYLGQDAFGVLAVIVMAGLVADNRKLRRRLREAGLPDR